jgi:hypothetical protein
MLLFMLYIPFLSVFCDEIKHIHVFMFPSQKYNFRVSVYDIFHLPHRHTKFLRQRLIAYPVNEPPLQNPPVPLMVYPFVNPPLDLAVVKPCQSLPYHANIPPVHYNQERSPHGSSGICQTQKAQPLKR